MRGASRQSGLTSLQELGPLHEGPTRPVDALPLPPPPEQHEPGETRVGGSERDATESIVVSAKASPAPAASDPHDEITNTSDLKDLLDETIIAGRYRIEEPIGEGGMGRVFRVRHRRLDKSFALKLMRTAFSGDTKARAMFYREARLAASLSHPNIVSIIDFGEDQRLGAFMVMELLDGEPLSVRLRGEGRFPLKQACEIILQIAEALRYIHQKEVVHCDIKPDNILLCPVPGTDRRKYAVKLLDFGLARMHVKTTKISAMVDGTPEYMAPERIRGNAPVPSMDIYSLGILCYEMLTGQLPFRGNIPQVMEAHVRQQPKPLSQLLKDPIDERAESLVMRALSKDPAGRQKDMTALIYELRTLMDMLGFGRRRGVTTGMRQTAPPTSPPGTIPVDKRTIAARTAFDLSPLPMAGIDIDGTIVVANAAFAQFLTGARESVVEGLDVNETRLLDVHPELPADLRMTHTQGNGVQRVLRLKSQDGRPVNLMLWIVAGAEGAGDVHVTVHVLDVPE
jgi:serine/threonine protein kinase